MSSNDLVVDSWEQLDEEDPSENGNEALDKLNAALEKLQVTKTAALKPAKDPFAVKKKVVVKKPDSTTSDGGSSGDEKETGSKYDGLRHIVIVKGNPVDSEALMHRISADFGRSVRMEEVDEKTVLLIFQNTLNSRHCVRSSNKYAPMKLYLIDEPEVDEHVAYCQKHKSKLRPIESVARPATNMSVIRQAVSRHLNVRVPVSTEQKNAEKEQIRQAKERKQAIKAMWD